MRGRLLFTLISIMGWLCHNSAAYALDPQVSAGLQKLLTDANDQRVKLDQSLVEALKEMHSVSANNLKTYVYEATMEKHESKIEKVKQEMSDNHLLIEFLNAFNSAMEDRAHDARKDAPDILLDLAHKQILDSVESSTDQKLWRFEMNLAKAIRDFMEPSQKFADFVSDYINKSHHLELSAAKYGEGRDYIGDDSDPNDE